MSRNSSPVKPFSTKSSPKKGLFNLTNANLSGKKKAPSKEFTNRRDELNTMFAIKRDDLLDKTMSDINTMENNEMSKILNRTSDAANLDELINAIERHRKKFTNEELPDVYDLLQEKPSAIVDQIGIELKKHIIKGLMDDIVFSKQKKDAIESVDGKAGPEEYEYTKEILLNNLKDDKKREALLEETLMREIHNEFMHDRRERIIKEALNRMKIKQTGNQTHPDESIKDILRPKQIRKVSDNDTEFFSFQKEIERKKQLNLIKLALETNKEKNQLDDRRKMNIEIMRCILMFKKHAQKRVQEKNRESFICMKMLRRAFTVSSHRDLHFEKNMMSEFDFKTCLEKCEIYPSYLKDHDIKGVFDSLTRNYERDKIDFYEFIEGLQKCAGLLIDEDDFEEEDYEEMENSNLNKDTKDVLLLQFYDEYLADSMINFELPWHKILNELAIKQVLKKHETLHTFLFNYFSHERQRTDFLEEKKEPLLNFEKIFDMFSLLDLFPTKCERLLLRSYYEYSIPDEFGLDYEDFTFFFPLIGLEIVDRYVKAEKKKPVKKKTFYTYEEEQESKKVKTVEDVPLTPLELLNKFYSNQFVGDMAHIKAKIKFADSLKNKDKLEAEKRFQIKNQFTESIVSYLNTKSMI